MVATMRDSDSSDAVGAPAAVPGLIIRESKRPSSRYSAPGLLYCKPRPIIDKPQAAFSSNFYNNNSSSIALDRLVEVALSPTDSKPSDFLNVSSSPGSNDLPGRSTTSTPAIARISDDEGTILDKNVDSPYNKKLTRHCNSNIIKAPSPDLLHTQPGGYFGHSQLAMEAQKLKRLNVQVSQPHHSKRFTPRFKSLLDISC